MFSRHQRLNYAEITSYRCDESQRWCALTGLIPQVTMVCTLWIYTTGNNGVHSLANHSPQVTLMMNKLKEFLSNGLKSGQLTNVLVMYNI